MSAEGEDLVLRLDTTPLPLAMSSEPNAWKEIERMRANAPGLGWPRALVFRKALSTGCLVRIGPRTCPSNCYSLTSGKRTVRCVSGDISANASRGSAETALHFTEHPCKQCLCLRQVGGLCHFQWGTEARKMMSLGEEPSLEGRSLTPEQGREGREVEVMGYVSVERGRGGEGAL